MIRNIIFDLGNVIIRYNQNLIIDEFAKNEEEGIFIKDKITDAAINIAHSTIILVLFFIFSTSFVFLI